MGVSIFLDGKSITPGWRSAMYTMLYETFGSGTVRLYEDDIERLEWLRDNQRKGTVDPPFDWSADIADAFNKIIARIQKKGSALIECRG